MRSVGAHMPHGTSIRACGYGSAWKRKHRIIIHQQSVMTHHLGEAVAVPLAGSPGNQRWNSCCHSVSVSCAAPLLPPLPLLLPLPPLPPSVEVVALVASAKSCAASLPSASPPQPQLLLAPVWSPVSTAGPVAAADAGAGTRTEDVASAAAVSAVSAVSTVSAASAVSAVSAAPLAGRGAAAEGSSVPPLWRSGPPSALMARAGSTAWQGSSEGSEPAGPGSEGPRLSAASCCAK